MRGVEEGESGIMARSMNSPMSKFVASLVTFSISVCATMAWLTYLHPAAPPKARGANVGSTAAAPEGIANSCEWQSRMNDVLPKAYREFKRSEAAPTVEELVAVDAHLRQLFRERPDYYPCEDEEHYRPEYADMGVHLGYWNNVVYSGKLLVDAHQLDPESGRRESTLFSTVMNVRPAHGLGEMPDIAAAFRYVEEFPDGSFAEDASVIIADFHKDLFMVLRANRRDYKYDCFKPYINRTPYSGQMKRAKKIAVSHYERVLAIEPSNARARKSLDEINDGTINSWSFCAD